MKNEYIKCNLIYSEIQQKVTQNKFQLLNLQDLLSWALIHLEDFIEPFFPQKEGCNSHIIRI